MKTAERHRTSHPTGRTLFAAAIALAASVPAMAQVGHRHADGHRTSTAAPEPTLPAPLEEARQSLRRYADPLVAIRDG